MSGDVSTRESVPLWRPDGVEDDESGLAHDTPAVLLSDLGRGWEVTHRTCDGSVSRVMVTENW